MCKEEKGTDEFRGENKTCNQCRDIENKKYAENTYTCPLCKFEIKTKRKSIHEKSVGHQYYLQQHEKNEEPEKPDVITIHNGVKHLCALDVEFLLMKAVGGRTCLEMLVLSTLKTKRNTKKEKKKIQTPMR